MERKRSVRRRQKPPFAQRAKDHCRSFTAFMFSNVGIIFLVVLYTILGSLMFMAIEDENASDRWTYVEKERNMLAAKLWNISCCAINVFNKTAFDIEVGDAIKNYQDTMVKTVKKGWPGNDWDKNEKQWSFSGGFLYSLTVITTIGYGNISPRTEWGKIATIFYAIIGMPLFLLYLSNIGDILAKSFKWIYAKLCLCRVCPGVARRRALREKNKRARTEPNEYDLESIEDSISVSTDADEEDNGGDTHTVTVPVTVCISIMIGYILFGAKLFSEWEKWDNLDGSYFCFISLSSIGFGDIVPGAAIQVDGQQLVDISFILCAVYLLLGMALIAMCFNLMQEQVMYKMQSLKRCVRRCFRCNR